MAKFSETADYKSVLQRLKNDFDKKWALDHASSHVKLSEFQPIRVLGAGGFGLVVRLTSFFLITIIECEVSLILETSKTSR